MKSDVVDYEKRLADDLTWAYGEAGMFFDQHGAIHATIVAITRKLDELGIPYAVVGGMAMFAHGYRRFTEDVDLLIPPEGLARLHESVDGLGYVPAFPGSRNLRDAATGVRIEFLLSGEFPGDGKPKPVAFPHPAANCIERDGVRYLNIEKLVELKLASGLSSPGRLRDLADVQELIRALRLPFDLPLDPSVLPEYQRLWRSIEETPS